MRATEGATVLNELVADGDVMIGRDPVGAYFALYHRTDKPDQIKPGTELQ